MKHVLLIVLLLLPVWAQQNTGSAVSAQSKATVYFYQSSGVFGADGATEITLDGIKVCTLHRSKFCVLEVQPGTHRVQSSREWPATELTFEPAKSYYFRLQIATARSIGYLSNLVLVPAETAEFDLRSCASAR